MALQKRFIRIILDYKNTIFRRFLSYLANNKKEARPNPIMLIDLLSEIFPQDKTSLGEIIALDMTGEIRKKTGHIFFSEGRILSYEATNKLNKCN